MKPNLQDRPSVLARLARWRIWLLLLLMVGLLGLLTWELPNYFAYRKSVAQLQAEWTRRKDLLLPLQRDEIAPLIAGSPEKIVVNDQNFRADYFSWLGFLHDFHLGITFDESGAVTEIEESPPRFDAGNEPRPPQRRLTAQEVQVGRVVASIA